MRKRTDKARLDDLERRVGELEARPPVTVQPIYVPAPMPYYPWWGIYPPQPYTVPVITYGGPSLKIVGNDPYLYGTITAAAAPFTHTLSAGASQ